MSRFRVPLVAIIALLLSGISGYAFHEGGDGYCEGCHLIVRSEGNQTLGATESSNSVTPRLTLKGPDASSTCLICHATTDAAHSVLSNDGSCFTPGGDFSWLGKTFTWTSEGRTYQSEGDSHGHNVVAIGYGLVMDGRVSLAPGGTYPSAALGCTSCHDPHAKTTGSTGDLGMTSVRSSYGEQPPTETPAGTFRLLGGIGYKGGHLATGITFKYPAPIAKGSSLGWAETDSNHTAYGSGMSEWCANCHTAFLGDNATAARRSHPAGNNAKITGRYANNYNYYAGTGDLSGDPVSAYLALVPFEVGTTNTALLDPYSSSGPGTGGNGTVMCLTCHRAHASAFRNMGRWDFEAALIADSHPQLEDGGAGGTDAFNSYYGRNIISEFGEHQRQFCNKCHVKD